MEAINKYYLNNGIIYPIKEFTDEDSKEKIIYEVLRVVNGKPAFLKDHLERMKKSFKLINKEFPYDEDEIEKLIIEVIKKNDNALGNIKITCNVNNNNFKIYYIMHSYPSKEYYKKGVKVILYYGERENPIKASEISDLDSLFISGTSVAILPISQVDDIKFDVNNEILIKIMKRYNELLENK